MATYGHGHPMGPGDYNQYGGQVQMDSEGHSPLDNMLRSIGGQTNVTKQTKDGQPQKRRGPKPDSKPAMTRRQELNRQAQRTHRERKEQYIKALEQEVLRLKELYANTTRERDVAVSDNQRLRDILKVHGIHFDMATPSASYGTTMPSYTGSVSGSASGSFGRQDSNTTGFSPSPIHSRQSPHQMQTGSASQIPNNRGLDMDQLGIDFVLALERPCMEHMQYLVVRSHNADGQPFHHPMERADDIEHDHMSGHALMATCPPYSHVMEKPGEPYPHQMPQGMSKPDLRRLLELSARLPTEGGEITPVRAWMQIQSNERCSQMTKQDFELVQADLLSKVRCYGFGAVLEEFEVADAINTVFAAREGMANNNMGAQIPHQHVMA
ncbi:transcription factor-like protein 12 [Elsinoe australis]|uniref:Transcription factor-like protein 12 n=1 Tax=Elsinoe australis TaxID=40998 RepID=A0A4U7B7Y0_9PEZI|nr:transcription factor-like protein 12 [Elsinoe australis]